MRNHLCKAAEAPRCCWSAIEAVKNGWMAGVHGVLPIIGLARVRALTLPIQSDGYGLCAQPPNRPRAHRVNASIPTTN